MPGRRTYNFLYWTGAARRRRGWDTGVGPELRALLESRRISPEALPAPTAVDLGCGSGANVLFLARNGFQVVGVDFSSVAVAQARRAAEHVGMSGRAQFVVGDATAERIEGVDGPFGLVVVYNTLQDLLGEDRRAIARTVHRLTAPGSAAVVWCYFRNPRDLPLLSFSGPSRLFPFVVVPGEEEELFGDAFGIERLPEPAEDSGTACFLMLRRG